MVDYYDTNREMTQNGHHFEVLCEMAELGLNGVECPNPAHWLHRLAQFTKNPASTTQIHVTKVACM
jgi:hypothetical protein